MFDANDSSRDVTVAGKKKEKKARNLPFETFWPQIYICAAQEEKLQLLFNLIRTIIHTDAFYFLILLLSRL